VTLPKVYNPDHTAHIRDRLKKQALYFATGAAVTLLSVVVLRVMTNSAGEVNRTLTLLISWLVRISLLLSALGLLITLASYRAYRRRRADLDAAGAEALGEEQARIRRNI
jgi:hypothetical protein